MDLIQLLVPIAATVALSYVVGEFSTVFSMRRHLRSELRTDVEILSSAPPGRARADLRRDVNRRLFLLTAFSKFAATTRAEVMLGVLVAVSWIALFYAALDEDLGLAGGHIALIAVVPLGVYLVLHESWCRRSADRLLYVYSNLGAGEAKTTAASMVFPAYLVPGVVGLITISLVGIGSSGANMPIWGRILIFAALSTAYGGMGAFAVYRRTALYSYLRYFVPEFFPLGWAFRKRGLARTRESLGIISGEVNTGDQRSKFRTTND